MTAPVVTLTDADILKRKDMINASKHLEARLGGLVKAPLRPISGFVYP